ncbi:hypothetical protein [Mammaliicoccus sp. Dog046]|uniref:hypothetical protein n=1 Tax=Mammaliicoccus sp. Dog046 TaxID=3034233 RepID=UPI002B2577D6|nr:hypothetical protein [Mammaliicoccus sp. Dog046]WQK85870.1 hypothetical protein P3U32_02235 [Mammaliicoccus sp. Dog046]
MFKFQFDYLKNGKGNHIKTIVLLVLSSIFIGTSLNISAFLFLGSILTSTAISHPIVTSILGLIGLIVLFFALSLIVLPLIIGATKFCKDTDMGVRPQFVDLFMFFKKSLFKTTFKYSSAMVAISMIAFFIFSTILVLILKVSSTIYPEQVSPFSASAEFNIEDNPINIIALSILFICYYLFSLYISTGFLVHIDKPLLSTKNKLSISWKLLFKGKHSLWKLLFNNLLFIIAYIVFIFVLAMVLMKIEMSLPVTQEALYITIYILGVIIYIVSIFFVSYTLNGGIYNFYHKNKNALYPSNNSETIE